MGGDGNILGPFGDGAIRLIENLKLKRIAEFAIGIFLGFVICLGARLVSDHYQNLILSWAGVAMILVSSTCLAVRLGRLAFANLPQETA